MNLRLVLYYLISSFFEGLALFLKHWYLDTWFFVRDFLKKHFNDSAPIAYFLSGILALIYLVWAILPIYLLLSGVIGYADFI